MQQLGLLSKERFPEVSETKGLEGSEHRADTNGAERKGRDEVLGTVFSYPEGDNSDQQVGEKEMGVG